MTDETELSEGRGDLPEPPSITAASGWERQRRTVLAGSGEVGDAAGDLPGARDVLTGAHSRASLHDRLRHEVDRARRYGVPVSILVIDLDHFKSVNDAFGHTRGDRVLIDFVERTQRLVRDTDLLFRYGGDEFILLLPHTDSQQALGFARRLIEGIHAVPFAGTPPLSVTVSIGSASFPGDGQTAEDLFERADRRLYEAKRQGRARVVADDPIEPGPFTFEVEARLLERELPLSALRHFLDNLPEHRRGILTISGPRGVGKSGFLAEATKAARLRGYAVWSLTGKPSMRNRLYGALAEATPPASGLPAPAAGEANFIQALQQSLVEQGHAGLLVAVDRLADVDAATLDLLRQLLFVTEIGVVAIAYTVDSTSPRRAVFLTASLRTQVELEALTAQGVRLWVRSVLRWEAPAAFSDWLHQTTQGLPGLLSQALHYLLDRNVLRVSHDVWHLAPDFQSVDLSEALQRRQQEPPQNLPVAPTGFVGRHDELQDIKRLLRMERLVAIVGAGGVGKTRLAVQAAAELSEHFADGLFFVPLDGAAASGFIVSAVAHALGLVFGGTEEARVQLLRHLSDRALLLILDDAEAEGEAARLLAELSLQAGGARVLVTSRAPLSLTGAAAYELRGLPIPPVAGIRGQAAASHYSAEQLFVQGAQRAAPAFVLSDEDRLYVRRICQLVEGLPLGIELAAAWTAMFSCQEIATEIENSLNGLGPADTAVPERQRSARAVLAYLWDLLAEDERKRLRWLALFRGGFDREAAQQVTGASLFLLSALVEKACLRRNSAGRYSMHDLTRQFAEGRLRASAEEWHQAGDTHCQYYADLMQRHQAPLKGGAQAAALANLRLEIGNIRMAWQWATTHGRATAIGQFFDTLVTFYASEQWYQEGAETFTRALEQWRAQHPAAPADLTLARLAAGQGVFMQRLGHNAAALAALEESLGHTRASEVGAQQRAHLAFTLYHLGLVLMDLGEYAQAQAVQRESLSLARGLDDDHGAALALSHLATLAHEVGDYLEARRHYLESVRLRRKAGDGHGLVFDLDALAEVEIDLGEEARAKEAIEESLSLAGSLGLPWGQALGQRSLGRLALARGDYARARAHFEASLKFSRSTGQRKGIGFDQLGLATAAMQTGDFGRAGQLLHEALTQFTTAGYQRGLAMTYAGLGELALITNATAARPHLYHALVAALRVRALPWVLAALVGMAALQLRAGEAEKAAELLTFALYHTASSRQTQRQAARLLSRLEGELPAQVVAAAEERGRQMALDPQAAQQLARGLLESSGRPTPHDALHSAE